MFSLQVIKKLHCYVTDLVHCEYILAVARSASLNKTMLPE